MGSVHHPWCLQDQNPNEASNQGREEGSLWQSGDGQGKASKKSGEGISCLCLESASDAKLHLRSHCDDYNASRICEVIDQNRQIRNFEERRRTWMHVVNSRGDMVPVTRPKPPPTK